MTPVMSPPVRKEMRRGLRLEKSLEGEDYVGGDIGVEGGDEESDERDGSDHGLVEFAEQNDGVPDGLAEDDSGGGGDGDADEGVQRHGGRQSEGLAPHLRFLGLGVAG